MRGRIAGLPQRLHVMIAATRAQLARIVQETVARQIGVPGEELRPETELWQRPGSSPTCSTGSSLTLSANSVWTRWTANGNLREVPSMRSSSTMCGNSISTHSSPNRPSAWTGRAEKTLMGHSGCAIRPIRHRPDAPRFGDARFQWGVAGRDRTIADASRCSNHVD